MVLSLQAVLGGDDFNSLQQIGAAVPPLLPKEIEMTTNTHPTEGRASGSDGVLRVFQCSESELIAAFTAEQAMTIYNEAGGDGIDYGDEYPRELSDAELDAPQPEFDEDERETGGTTSVRQMLAEQGQPGHLASTRW